MISVRPNITNRQTQTTCDWRVDSDWKDRLLYLHDELVLQQKYLPRQSWVSWVTPGWTIHLPGYDQNKRNNNNNLKEGDNETCSQILKVWRWKEHDTMALRKMPISYSSSSWMPHSINIYTSYIQLQCIARNQKQCDANDVIIRKAIWWYVRTYIYIELKQDLFNRPLRPQNSKWVRAACAFSSQRRTPKGARANPNKGGLFKRSCWKFLGIYNLYYMSSSFIYNF